MLPSPSISPVPKINDDNYFTNRKRQRSRSMESEPPASSSSPKRTIIPDTNLDSIVLGPQLDETSSTSLHDEIDKYMSEQGEQDMPLRLPCDSLSWRSVPPAEKVAIAEQGKNSSMKPGDTWYLVARVWWKKWRKACTGEEDKDGRITEMDLDPVDNSTLLDAHQKLKITLDEGIDYEFVPEAVWKNFVDWYGTPNHPLPRQAIARGSTSTHISLELHPPSFNVFRLANRPSHEPGPRSITVSALEKVKSFAEKIAILVHPGQPPLPPYRVWRVELNGGDECDQLDFPVSMLDSSQLLTLDSENTIEDQLILPHENFVVEFKGGMGWIRNHNTSTAPIQPLPTLVGRQPSLGGPVFDSNQNFFNRMSTSASTASTAVSRVDSFRANSSFGTSSSWTTVQTRPRKLLEPGTLGLGNLGNTCFMNSALQCLAHNQELTDYFLSGVYQMELNRRNPLGMGGAIAEAFGDLLRRIWSDNGTSSSYSPRDFKGVLQRFAPQFSGYQQHDSQELVAFLLDGLHEDLNRVLKKPYVEKPDWEGGGDVELVRLAQKSWEGYKLRNDSVIVDLFQGQYQSTLVCPECQKVSITFDPFMYLTLPLPVQKSWTHTILYVPWDLNRPHVEIPVEMKGNASFRDLRILLGRWMGAIPENLLTFEIFKNRFYKNLDDSVLCGDMSASDIIVCFELPCHAQQTAGYERNPDDPLLIPIYLCDVTTFRFYTHQRSYTTFGYPAVIALTREETADKESIYGAVLNRLQRWTKNARDFFHWEEGPLTPMHEVSPAINGFQPIDTLTEIRENGDIIAMDVESDIVDVKIVNDEAAESLASEVQLGPKQIGMKRDVFKLRLQSGHKDFGTRMGFNPIMRSFESWDSRLTEAGTTGTLLREGDVLFCEFDENMKAYYFGEEQSWEHALWNTWETFEHPEYIEQKKVAAKRHKKGLSLQDCLEEFTKEEKLGQDDVWYCPQCKKHQQATKKFDLWNVPDILVVHLKRFSNNRTFRDKIEDLIDFPVEGLDLSSMVGERAVMKRLLAHGATLEELESSDLNEPLLYDLFGVDEHLGGLGAGHYRAYALNHVTNKWYHFDDSYVLPAKASEAVNANAYLLCYRRRSSSPLGGKSHHKIQEAKVKPVETSKEDTDVPAIHFLPTPPSEDGLPEVSAPSTQHQSDQTFPSELLSIEIPDASMSDETADSLLAWKEDVHTDSPASNAAELGDGDDAHSEHNSEGLEDSTIASSGSVSSAGKV